MSLKATTKKTILWNLPLGTQFRKAGGQDHYETITHSHALIRTSNPKCKRDCWNLTKKRMERISYRQEVIPL